MYIHGTLSTSSGATLQQPDRVEAIRCAAQRQDRHVRVDCLNRTRPDGVDQPCPVAIKVDDLRGKQAPPA
jgi:hypothetical protein